jgi:hypothetical protein
MRRLALVAIMAFALAATACESDHDELDHITGEFPEAGIPTSAHAARMQEGDGARVFEVVGVTWRDGCLEVYRRGYLCTGAEVHGYRVLVEKRGWLIEYRTAGGPGAIRVGPIGHVADHPAAAGPSP